MAPIVPLFNTHLEFEEVEAVLDVIDTGKFIMGDQVQALESELNNYLGAGGVVTCASGTDALEMAIEGLDCAGYGIIVPAMTFSATCEAVLRKGGIPIICDVDEKTLTPSRDQIRDVLVRSITNGIPVRAVCLVHLYGWPAYDTLEIADFCRSVNLFLIEDCAQAFGASLEGIKVGNFGDAAAFSFYPTKPLGGIGDGGAVYFQSKAKAEYMAEKRNHGRGPGGQTHQGFNSRLDEINAAVIRCKLSRYGEIIERRRAVSGRYHINGIKKMSFTRKGNGVPYVYPVLVDNREAVRYRLAEIGVETRIHYDPAICDLPYVNAECPNAKWVSRRVLSLPCHENVSDAQVDMISDALRS